MRVDIDIDSEVEDIVDRMIDAKQLASEDDLEDLKTVAEELRLEFDALSRSLEQNTTVLVGSDFCARLDKIEQALIPLAKLKEILECLFNKPAEVKDGEAF